MWFAWFVLGLMMIFTNRWFGYLTNKSNYIHAFFGYSIVILTVYATASILAINGWKTTGLHNNLGLICSIGLLVFALTGTTTFILRLKLEWNTWIIKIARRVHKYLALVFWAFSLFTMTMGMILYIYDRLSPLETPTYSYFVWLNIIVMVGITLSLELFYQWNWRQEDSWNYPKLAMSEDEFEKRVKEGQKLVVLDNMVLDIGGYAYAHPGGAFLINYNVGRDISKFIYGSYALFGNGNDPKKATERHAHSNIARKIANRHAIATLKKDAVRWD